MKVVLLEVLIIILIFWEIQRDQMEGESGVSGSIIDQLDCSAIQGDRMEDESGVSRSIIDEIHSWDIQRDQIGRESGVT